MRHHVTQLGAHPEETKLFNLLGTLGAQEERYRSCLMDAIEPLREHYSEIIRRGRELKRFECNDHESVAVLIVATIRGLCSHAALDDQGRLPAAASDCAELILRLAQPQKSAASLSTPWQPPEPRTSN